MSERRALGGLLLALSVILLSCPTAAHAYVDPGTGNYLFQLTVAGLFGALYTLKVYWRNIRSFMANALHRRPASH